MNAWARRRLKYVVDINSRSLPETTQPDTEFRYVDISACGRGALVTEPEPMKFAEAPSRARRLVQEGDTIVSTVRTYLRAVWPVTGPSDDLVVSTGFAVLSPRPRLDSRFLGWLMQSDLVIEEIVARSVGVSYPAINGLEIGNLEVPVPSQTEQRAIADYLDRETARIDAVAERRRAQVSALQDRLSSEVEGRVVGALEASGRASQRSPFFLSRPIDWNETTLRHLGVEVQTGPFGSQLHAEEYVEGGTPVINPMHLVDGTVVPSSDMAVGEYKKQDLSRHLLSLGDIVVARRGELGRVAVVDQASAGYLCGTGCLRLRPRRSLVRAGYLSILLSSARLRAYFETTSVGSTMDNLSAETLLAAPVLVPPLDEQADIESAVEAARHRIQGMIELMSRQAERLLERRQALITAAVTGQIDIPGVAA